MSTEVEQSPATLQVEQADQASKEDFVSKVGSYPVVASTVSHVIDFYSRCKESNDLVKYSLETAESGVKYIAGTSAPVITKLEKPISTVNDVACAQLNNLEEKYPIIAKPTDDVIAESKKLYDENIKPSVDRVAGVGYYATEKCSEAKDYSVSKVNDVTNYSAEKITMVRDKSYEALNMVKDKSYETLNTVLASPVAQTFADKLDGALDVAENYVDQYLPEKMDTEKPAEEIDEAEVKARPVVVYDKARQRLYSAAITKLQDVQLRSKQTLERLNFTVNLIDYAKANMESVNTKISGSYQAVQDKGAYWWDEIRKDEETEENADPDAPQTIETQSIRVARNLTRKLRLCLYSLNDVVIPDNLTDRIAAAKEYSTELMTSFMKVTKIDDLSDTIMTRAKDQVAYIQETMSYVGEVAFTTWPLNQAVPDVAIDDLNPDINELEMEEGEPISNGEATNGKKD